MSIKAFTSKQIELLAGLNVKNLHDYVGAGKIKPGIQTAKGSGSITLYSPENVMQGKIISRCVELGLARRTVFRLMDSLNDAQHIGELNPYEIIVGGIKFLHFFCSPQDDKYFHRFQFVSKVVQEGDVKARTPWTDCDDIDVSLRFNLTILADQIVQKIEALNF